MEINENLPESIAKQLRSPSINASPAIGRFMEELAERQREPNGAETFVEELDKFGVSKNEAIAFLKQLASIGCGKFITGRHGAKSRMSWKPYGAIPVAKAFLSPPAVESEHDTETSSRDHEAFSEVKTASTESNAAVQMHTHTFLLRPNLIVQVELPLDLSKEEACRFAEFIRAVPF